MKADLVNKMIVTLIFMLASCTNYVFASDQIKNDTAIIAKTDTIDCYSEKVIIEYPLLSKAKYDNYEEGFFKMISCYPDTAAIVFHFGSMVNLPLTDLSDKIIESRFILGKDVRIIRGYYVKNGRKKFFREDNFFRYNITIVYYNVETTALDRYEHYFNNVKIIKVK